MGAASVHSFRAVKRFISGLGPESFARVVAVGGVVLLSAVPAFSQSSVRAKYLTGEWRMVFAIDDAAKPDSPMERVAVKVASGILDEVDIRFEFRPDHVLKVTADVFGSSEVEFSTWTINEKNELILGESEHYSSDDTVWMFNDGRLMAYHYKDGVREATPEPVFLEVVRG